MFLRVTHQRRADGSKLAHLQIAESEWDKQKKRSKTRILHNIGRADDEEVIERLRRLARSIQRRCSPEEIAASSPGWRLLDAWPYGDVYVLDHLWRRLGIDDVIRAKTRNRRLKYECERALFAMVANRACAPCSKLYCFEQWLREDVRIDGTQDLQLHQLYRAMDFLEANKEEVEKEIFFRVSDLLNLDVDLVFYDTTSLHFEIDQEDEGGDEEDVARGSRPSGGKDYRPLRKRGKSKNKRDDVPQIVVGLAVTREGFPIRHWVFPGNTVDVTTVKKVRADLKGWKLSRCVFVGDAGMVSESNLDVLRRGGGHYILCMPLRRGDDITKQVATRAGRYEVVADNLQVKEVIVGEGMRSRRYVLCFNPQEAERQKHHRNALLLQLEAELTSLKHISKGSHSRRVCELRASKRYGRFLRIDERGRPHINVEKVRSEEKLDGKFVVHTSDDSLTPADVALGYKQLARVEEAWRSLKSGLKLRPMFHWAPHRIHAHISLTIFSLLLERVAEHSCGDTWRNIRDDLRKVKLAQLLGPDGEVWQVTEPNPGARKRLELLGIQPPPPVLALR